MSTPAHDICVIGGAGHVGAPLSVVLAAAGHRTLVYDVNRDAMDRLQAGSMPFLEEGSDTVLEAALASGCLGFTGDPSLVAGVPVLIVTIGTPIDEFRNPQLEVVARCVDTLLPYISDDQTIILRSTVFPGVTEYLADYLAKQGKHPGVAFCPERVVQGRAIVELRSLPQIVSGLTAEAENVAARVFESIAPKIVRMVVKEAEFAKLISNAWRYIQFAAANQFYMMVEAAGLDHQRLLRGLKEDYPRIRDLPGPGFAAGPCLMKDTMQLVAFNNDRFSLGNVAVTVNEGLPNFLVERLSARRKLSGARVGILGMAFKSESDDTRDSLSYKLAKILRFRGATVLCSDEYVADPSFVTKEQLVANSDVAIVAVPHRAYRTLAVPAGVEIVDLWEVIPRKD